MIASLRKLFRPGSAQPRSAVPPGERVYAIGDVHGRADLFAALVAAVEADDRGREPAKTTFVMLGDLVDRGPDSAGVVRMAREWSQRRGARLIAGNHEEMFLQSLSDTAVLRQFLRHGGRETALSYPIDPDSWNAATLDEARLLLRSAVPEEDIAYLRRAEDMVLIGDYLFVHAGIAPGVPLDQQVTSDMRWIREPFLSSRQDIGLTVVHGHTITTEAEERPNRIGIDTGAFASGKLTAIGLEGTHRWLIEACQTETGAIEIETRALA